MNFAQQSILWLKILRQRISFNQRSIFELQLSFDPLLPSFLRVDDWVDQLKLLFLEVIFQLFRLFIQDQSFQNYFVINISIQVFLVQSFVCFGILQLFLLLEGKPGINQPGYLIKPWKNSILQGSQSVGSNVTNVGPILYQKLNDFKMIPFDGVGQSSLSFRVDKIDICLELQEQFDKFKVSVM